MTAGEVLATIGGEKPEDDKGLVVGVAEEIGERLHRSSRRGSDEGHRAPI